MCPPPCFPRFAVPDTMSHVCDIIGPDRVLQVVAMVLERALSYFRSAYVPPPGVVSDAAWRPLEASLFSIRGIAEVVPDTEAAVLPSVIGLVLELPPHPEILYVQRR